MSEGAEEKGMLVIELGDRGSCIEVNVDDVGRESDFEPMVDLKIHVISRDCGTSALAGAALTEAEVEQLITALRAKIAEARERWVEEEGEHASED